MPTATDGAASSLSVSDAPTHPAISHTTIPTATEGAAALVSASVTLGASEEVGPLGKDPPTTPIHPSVTTSPLFVIQVYREEPPREYTIDHIEPELAPDRDPLPRPALERREWCAWLGYQVVFTGAKSILNVAGGPLITRLATQYMEEEATSRCLKTPGCEVPEPPTGEFVTARGATLPLLGLTPDGAAFATEFIFMLISLFGFVLLGKLGDYGRYRYYFFVLFTSGYGVCGLLFGLCWDPSTWWLAFLLVILCGVQENMMHAYANSYIPIYARAMESATVPRRDDIHHEPVTGFEDLADPPKEVIDRNTTKITTWRYFSSSAGIFLGVSFFLANIFAMGALGYDLDSDTLDHNGNYAYTTSLATISAATLLTLLVFIYPNLTHWPAKPARPAHELVLSSAKTYLTLIRDVASASGPSERDMKVFLAGWFLVSDGYSIIFILGPVLAAQHGVLTGLAPFFFLNISLRTVLIWCLDKARQRGWLTTRAIAMGGLLFYLLALVAWAFMPAFARRYGWLTATGLGFLVLQLPFVVVWTYLALWFSQLIPTGRETQYWTLYQITDRGSSLLGPLVLTFCATAGDAFLVFIYAIPMASAGVAVLLYLYLTETTVSEPPAQNAPGTGSSS